MGTVYKDCCGRCACMGRVCSCLEVDALGPRSLAAAALVVADKLATRDHAAVGEGRIGRPATS